LANIVKFFQHAAHIPPRITIAPTRLARCFPS